MSIQWEFQDPKMEVVYHIRLCNHGCSQKNPADSLPTHDSAKNMVWSAQQLSFLIENGLMQDVAFCFRLQHLQCFCAPNESNWQRSFFLCQHSQLCQSLACFHKQGLWAKFPTPLLAADVFLHPTPSSCCHEASKWRSKSVTKQVQRALLPQPTPSSCCHEASKWRSKSMTKQVQRTLFLHPTPSSCCHEASKWGSKSVTKQVQRALLPHPTPSSCCHEASKWRSKLVTKQVQRTLLPHPTPPHAHPKFMARQTVR